MTTDLVETSGRALEPISPPDTDSWTGMLVSVAQLAERIAETDFVPQAMRGSAAAVTAAILYGREVGLPPMTALTQVYVYDGRPALYAEAMRALVLAAGHELEIRQATGASVTVAGRRRGSDRWQEVVWNLDMARAAGLVRDRSGWSKFPRAMLVAKATAELCRQLFPDVIHGFRAMEDLSNEPDATVRVADEDQPPSQAEPVTVQRKQAAKRPQKQPTSAGKAQAAPKPGKALSDAPEASQTPSLPSPQLPPQPEQQQPPRSAEPPPGEVSERRAEGGSSAAPPHATSSAEEPASPLPIVAPPFSRAEQQKTSPADAEEVNEEPAVEEPDEQAGMEIIEEDITDEEPADPIEVIETSGEDPNPQPARRLQIVRLLIEFQRLGVTSDEHRYAYLSALFGRDVSSSNELTQREASQAMDVIALCQTRDGLDEIIGATEAKRAEQGSLLSADLGV